MTTGIEHTIIAYFEGSLSDTESAELLHLASVSPEIRVMFREHEMLHELALEASQNVTISPEVESSLFSRIESLSELPVRSKSVLVFSRRTAILAALALILLSGSLGYFAPKIFSSASSEPLRHDNISFNPSPAFVTSSTSTASPASTNIYQIADIQNSTREQNIVFNSKENDDEIISGQSIPIIEGAINQVNIKTEDIHPQISNESLSPFDQLDMPTESPSHFEASLQTSSGFTYPADAAPIKPFADMRLSVAYHLSENNLIGLRIGSGLYQELAGPSHQIEDGVEIIRRPLETKRNFSEEVFISHLIPVFFAAPFSLEFSLGSGLIPGGYLIDAEAGIRIPISESFLFDAAFALSRVHSNAPASADILRSESTGMMPVILDAADIHTTVNGRLHYGLLYKF